MLNTRRFRIKEFLDRYYSLPPKERRRALIGLYKRVDWMIEEAWALEMFEERKDEPSRPFEEYLAERKAKERASRGSSR